MSNDDVSPNKPGSPNLAKGDSAQGAPGGVAVVEVERPEWVTTAITTAASIGLALVAGAVLIAFSDEEAVGSLSYFGSYPWDFFRHAGSAIWDSYAALVEGAVGGTGAIGTSLVRAAPLICAGLAVAIPFRAGMFNIGAQGQLIVGSLCGIYAAISWDLPALIHIPVVIVTAMLGGALYGLIPGLLKARTGAHEVITTIMLNNISTAFLLPWILAMAAFQRPGSSQLLTPRPAESTQLWSVGSVHVGVLLAFAAAFGVWWLVERSTFGFEMRAVGANPEAARTAGMNVSKVYVGTFMVAGALAGLAATMNMLGKGDPISLSTAGSVGFDAITVALLGRATPLGTVLAGLLFGALSVGGSEMQIVAGTPQELANVLQALIVLFVAAPMMVKGLLRLRSGGTAGAQLTKGWS